MPRKTLVILLLLAAPNVRSAVAAVAPYVINSGGSWSAGFAINDSGAIAGVFDQYHPYAAGAFLYDNGVRELIGADALNAASINASNQIVGHVSGRAYLYSGGQRYDLGTPFVGSSALPNAINDFGQIVGTATDPLGNLYAFSYSGGNWTDIGYPSGFNSYGAEVIANDVNNAGTVVGSYDSWLFGNPDSGAGAYASRGFVFENGVMTDIGTLGGLAAIPTAINNLGQITGWSTTADNKVHAFLYSEGVMVDLGAFNDESRAYGINDLGQVVGVSDGKPFLYSGGTLVDLTTQFYDPEWRLAVANGINNVGQIVGSGYLVGGTDQTPYIIPAAFILTPVPEPSSYLLACIAISCLLGFRKDVRGT